MTFYPSPPRTLDTGPNLWLGTPMTQPTWTVVRLHNGTVYLADLSSTQEVIYKNGETRPVVRARRRYKNGEFTKTATMNIWLHDIAHHE